jgi:hypothetical protein
MAFADLSFDNPAGSTDDEVRKSRSTHRTRATGHSRVQGDQAIFGASSPAA